LDALISLHTLAPQFKEKVDNVLATLEGVENMALSADQAWSQCLGLIKDNVNEQSYITWFKPTSALSLKNHELTINVPNHFIYEWIEGHYSDLLKRAVSQVLGEYGRLQYATREEKIAAEEPAALPVLTGNAKKAADQITNLSPNYTFDNFVEGSSNQFAKAAALAVGEAPGKTSFNPLVIYGGVGLGKTHLIQAIGNFSLRLPDMRRVIYVSSEKFTIEFINSIQNNRSTEFSAIYRNVDILLVDDIQFFSNKERTQEEFFHTFNTLHQKGKQIVLSCDRPPKDIAGIEERLLSRFQWGLVVDIQPPDLETRIAILQRKAEENKIELPYEVIQLIAYNVTSNIRELEGCLIRLLAYSSLSSKDVSLELARNVLKDQLTTKQRNVSIEDIQKMVCEYFSIPDDLLRAKTRKKEIAYARQVAMYIAKKTTNSSLKTIGLHFGGRDHTTVIHAIETVQSQMKSDVHCREDVQSILQKHNLQAF
jgi:chromosomal replication initiator protein